MARFIRIGSTSDLPRDGEAREFAVGGRVLCVANIDSKFAAIDNVCAHHGGPLGQGVVAAGHVICPWHGWEYDPQTGASTHDPQMKVDVYALKIEGDDVLVDMGDQA